MNWQVTQTHSRGAVQSLHAPGVVPLAQCLDGVLAVADLDRSLDLADLLDVLGGDVLGELLLLAASRSCGSRTSALRASNVQVELHLDLVTSPFSCRGSSPSNLIVPLLLRLDLLRTEALGAQRRCLSISTFSLSRRSSHPASGRSRTALFSFLFGFRPMLMKPQNVVAAVIEIEVETLVPVLVARRPHE